MRTKTTTVSYQSDNPFILHLNDCEVNSWTAASGYKKLPTKNVCLDEFV